MWSSGWKAGAAQSKRILQSRLLEEVMLAELTLRIDSGPWGREARRWSIGCGKGMGCVDCCLGEGEGGGRGEKGCLCSHTGHAEWICPGELSWHCCPRRAEIILE